MYFNSYEFIFLFLPIVIGGYFLLGARKNSRLANIWLLVAGLFFYGYWDAAYLSVLVGSIVANFVIAGRILKAAADEDDFGRRLFFAVGLLFNIGLLGWFKYADFVLENVNCFWGTNIPLPNVELPLGISFFTITQLICLYDCQAGSVKKNGFLDYALFVSFFPHLLSGPILYHRSMMKQFRDEKLRRLSWANMAEGLTLFIIGLVKKVVIADSFIAYIDGGFAAAEHLTLFHAWFISASYFMQLYFDFSGYSDMAIGMAKIMNIAMPINFNSPAKAKSLIEFWQRWHISLTNAITGCLYQPMLRSFASPKFRHVIFCSFVTFVIVGVWHGAGWTYVVFGLMHAVGVVVNHVWRRYKLWMPSLLAHLVTMTYVVITMVIFRAADLAEGWRVIKAMFGVQGVLVSEKMADMAAQLWQISLPVGHIFIDFPYVTFAVALFLLFFVPNSTQLIKKFRPSVPLAIILITAFAYAVSKLGETTDFLYFQF